MSLSQRPDLAACVGTGLGALFSGIGIQSLTRLGPGAYNIVTVSTFDAASIPNANTTDTILQTLAVVRVERQPDLRTFKVLITDETGAGIDTTFAFRVERLIT